MQVMVTRLGRQDDSCCPKLQTRRTAGIATMQWFIPRDTVPAAEVRTTAYNLLLQSSPYYTGVLDVPKEWRSVACSQASKKDCGLNADACWLALVMAGWLWSRLLVKGEMGFKMDGKGLGRLYGGPVAYLPQI